MKADPRVGVVLAAMLLAHPASAHDLTPGLYEIEVNVDERSQSERLTRCITADGIERHDPFEVFSFFPTTNCLKLPMCFGNGKGGFDIVCVGGRADKAEARFRYSRDRFSGTIELTRQDDGHMVRVVEKQRGRRIGACDGNAD